MTVLLPDGLDAGLAWHHGDPNREGRAVASGDGVCELGNREIVEVSGPDRLSWLHSLSTQHVCDLAPGQSATMLFLSPTGRIEHVLYGVDDGESLLGWTEPGRADALVAWLTQMKFMLRVDVSRRDDLRLVWCGEQVAVPPTAISRSCDFGGTELLLPHEVAAPTATPVGTWALAASRIAAGVPRIFVDTDAKTIPNEIGLVGTHLDKGCYRGQETVARVHNLGRPPRRLVLLQLDGSVDRLPTPGAALELAGRPIGFVGGSARHHELGPIALGLVKRAVDLSAELLVDGIAAAQEMLVDPEVGYHIRPQL